MFWMCPCMVPSPSFDFNLNRMQQSVGWAVLGQGLLLRPWPTMSALAKGGRVKDWAKDWAKDWHIFWFAALKVLEAINTLDVTWSYFEKYRYFRHNYTRGHDSSSTWTASNILGGSVNRSEEDSIEWGQKTQKWIVHTFRWGQTWHKTFGRTASRSILVLISDTARTCYFLGL